MLAEWDVRCELGGVHNAIAYLYGLIKKVVEGVFKLWVARKSAPAADTRAGRQQQPA